MAWGMGSFDMALYEVTYTRHHAKTFFPIFAILPPYRARTWLGGEGDRRLPIIPALCEDELAFC